MGRRRPTAALYLVLDQGGHASRALVFDDSGRELSRHFVPVATREPQPGWVEHDAEALVQSLRDAAARAVTGLGAEAGRLVAAGLACQRSTIVCWDRPSGRALAPVVSWQDRRAAPWLARQGFDAADIHRRTGLVVSPHYGAGKLRWCLDHVEAVARAYAAHHLAMGPLAGFLLHRLLTEQPWVCDPANAGRTLLWNPGQGQWDDHLLGCFGIPREVLPEVVPSAHAFGTFEAAGREMPLAVVHGDQPAALFADGQPDHQAAYVNLGTGAFIQRVGQGLVQATGLLSSVAAMAEDGATLYALEGTVNGGARALHWAADELGLAGYEEQMDLWLADPREPPLFLNGVAGLGAPYWVPEFPSRFVGQGDAPQRMVAVAESILFLLQTNLERISEATGPVQRLVCTGGLSGLDPLCQRLADLSGRPVARPRLAEATARGTAFWLAGRPASWVHSPCSEFQPRDNPALAARYRRWGEAMSAALD